MGFAFNELVDLLVELRVLEADYEVVDKQVRSNRKIGVGKLVALPLVYLSDEVREALTALLSGSDERIDSEFQASKKVLQLFIKLVLVFLEAQVLDLYFRFGIRLFPLIVILPSDDLKPEHLHVIDLLDYLFNDLAIIDQYGLEDKLAVLEP